MLNRKNLMVYKIASDCLTRPAICSVLIESKRTLATDGKIGAIVTDTEEAVEINKPLLISRDSAEFLAGQIERKDALVKITTSTPEEAGRIEVELKTNDGDITIKPRIITEFTFPKLDSIFEQQAQKPVVHKVAFDPALLKRACELFIDLGIGTMTLEFVKEPTEAVIARGTKGSISAKVAIMPLRTPAEDGKHEQ